MTLPIVYRPEVRVEVDEAYAWYEEQRRGLGDEFLTAIRAAVDLDHQRSLPWERR